MSVYNQTETSLIVLFHLLWFSVGLYLSQNSPRYLYKFAIVKRLFWMTAANSFQNCEISAGTAFIQRCSVLIC